MLIERVEPVVEKDHRQGLEFRLLPNVVAQRKAVLARHRDLGDQHVRERLVQQAQGGVAIVGTRGLNLLDAQRVGHHLLKVGITPGE